ncbi:MAG TPA: hypothetical protein GXX59_07065 [Syntrophomonadaceae bacterium]|nr:hypothetical protein [Syntrophomonadaceae bacterium]
MAGENSEKLNPHEQRGKGVVVNQKILIIGCVAVVLCAVIALFTAFMVVRNGIGENESSKTANNAAAQVGQLFEVGEFTTNLASGGAKKYVKVTVVLELNNRSLEKEIKEKLPVLKDKIIIFFNSKTSDDLEAENRVQLKKAILADLNTHLSTGKVDNIYFSDLVLQ